MLSPIGKTNIFWHRLWRVNGSPTSGWLSEIRKKTRAKYHYALRQIRKEKDKILASNLAENVVNNNTNDFWASVKKVKGCKPAYVNCVDNVVGGENISNHLVKKYSDLYNSVSYDKHEMQATMSQINTLVSNKCCSQKCYFKHSFCVGDVYDAVKLLKTNKTDGSNQWSNSIINGCHRLFVYLSILYNLMLRHGFSPKDLLVSTIVPIPKIRKNL